MAHAGDKKFLALDHRFRTLKLETGKVKLQLDEILEMCLGRMLTTKFSSVKRSSERFLASVRIIDGALAMTKSLHEFLEAFTKSHASENLLFPDDFEIEELLHPEDFNHSSDPDYQQSTTMSPEHCYPHSTSVDVIGDSLPFFEVAPSETADLPLDMENDVSDIVCASTDSPESMCMTIESLAKTDEAIVTNISGSCYYLTSSVQTPILSVLPLPTTPRSMHSDSIHSSSPVTHKQGTCFDPLLSLPTPPEIGFVSFDGAHDLTFEVISNLVDNESPEGSKVNGDQPILIEECKSILDHEMVDDSIFREPHSNVCERNASDVCEANDSEHAISMAATKGEEDLILPNIPTAEENKMECEDESAKDSELNAKELLPGEENSKIQMPLDGNRAYSTENSVLPNTTDMECLGFSASENDLESPANFPLDNDYESNRPIENGPLENVKPTCGKSLKDDDLASKNGSANGQSDHSYADVEVKEEPVDVEWGVECNEDVNANCISDDKSDVDVVAIETEIRNTMVKHLCTNSLPNEEDDLHHTVAKSEGTRSTSCSSTSGNESPPQRKKVEGITLHEPVDIYLSYFQHPNSIWIQKGDCKILQLQDNLRENIEKEGATISESLNEGLQVAARYRVDGLFYRAVVIRYVVGDEEAEVLFLDYGNLEKTQTSDLYTLPSELRDAPPMARLCTLTHVNDIELTPENNTEVAVLLNDIESCIRNTTMVKGVFEELSSTAVTEPSTFNSPRFNMRLILDIEILPVQATTSGGQVDWKGVEETSLCVSEGDDDDKASGADDVGDAGNTNMKTTFTVPVEENWLPLPEEIMQDSHGPSDGGSWWSAVSKMPIKSSVFTVDADRQISHGQEDEPIPEASVLVRDCTSMEPDVEDTEDSDTMIPTSTLPTTNINPFTVPIGVVVPVRISHVVDPKHFYLHLHDSETATLLKVARDRFQDTMNDFYRNNKDILKVKLLPVGSFWAVKDMAGNWYRGSILANKFRSPDKKGAPREVSVRFIDFGYEEVVPIRNVRVLHENFTFMHVLAIPCTLFRVHPINGFQNNEWSKTSIKAFIRKCGGIKGTLFAKFHAPNKLSRVHDVTLRTLEGENVNRFLVKSGYAKSSQSLKCSPEVEELVNVNGSPSVSLPGDVTGTAQCEDNLNDWDPMTTEYLAEENNVNVDNECAESMLVGMKNADESRLCKFYRQGKKCPREVCRWEHTRLRGVTTVKEPIILSCTDPFEYPESGAVLMGVVSCVVSPSEFYLYFPNGTKDLRDVGGSKNGLDSSDDENFVSLNAAMNRYYKYSLPQPHLSLPGPGELKVVCGNPEGQHDFARVRIMENARQNDVNYVKVFYIDYGGVAWVKEEQIRNLVPQFSHLPPQAVESFLEGLSKPGTGWDDYLILHLQRMTEKLDLVVQITSVDRLVGRLGVELYNTNGPVDIHINKVLCNKMNM